MLFTDRRDAGQRLARRILALELDQPLVFGIPRGGMVVAHEVSQALKAPLDILIPRKIGAPGNPELAIGAVAQDGTVVMDRELVAALGVDRTYIEDEVARQVAEIERRLRTYRQGRPAHQVAGRTAVVVDDGIATGATVLAALRGLRSAHPGRVLLAVPVSPPDTLARLQQEADQLVCLATPEPFYAVGQFYRRFEPTADEEVIGLLQSAAASPD